MPDKYAQEYVKVTTHRFKTRLSHYLRMLETDMCRAIIVRRGKENVAMVFSIDRLARDAEAAAAEEEDGEDDFDDGD